MECAVDIGYRLAQEARHVTDVIDDEIDDETMIFRYSDQKGERSLFRSLFDVKQSDQVEVNSRMLPHALCWFDLIGQTMPRLTFVPFRLLVQPRGQVPHSRKRTAKEQPLSKPKTIKLTGRETKKAMSQEAKQGGDSTSKVSLSWLLDQCRALVLPGEKPRENRTLEPECFLWLRGPKGDLTQFDANRKLQEEQARKSDGKAERQTACVSVAR